MFKKLKIKNELKEMIRTIARNIEVLSNNGNEKITAKEIDGITRAVMNSKKYVAAKEYVATHYGEWYVSEKFEKECNKKGILAV